ncbi:MAG TPA: type I-A CRISPR-associated protein Cas5a [Geobacterales bacterium]|nr:type I-A CRISPR-associated protein Cas5a [Geobacterales bacterium]
MKAFVISLRFHWGYSIRTYFASKMSDAYLIPPKSSIIGAIARSISARNGSRVEYYIKDSKVMGSSALAYENTIKDYAIKLEGYPLRFNTLLRLLVYPYWVTKFDIEKGESNFFNVVETGMVSYPGGLIRLLLVSETLEKEDLFSIIRLGSKESITSVVKIEEVTSISKKNKGEKIRDVTFSFNSDLAESILGSFVYENTPEFDRYIYEFELSRVDFRIEFKRNVIPQPFVRVVLKSDCYLYETPYGNAILEYGT